ncbi:hypothetical protein [Marinobacter sp. SS21]|uniref:hypothetical protein n=1 Tax=Marinobacter sp. SS21 TaxID=2979460 RepID=UPI00232B26C8|nr:hypothetical protein [Marinobacter sp. SS21]MDC0662798.1 hypothetical protein [Marinobacter sp. SS21]
MLRTLTFLLMLLLPTIGVAAEFRVGLLHGDAEIFDYELSVLRLALAHAPGSHSLSVVPLPGTTQERVFSILDAPRAPINVFFSGYSPERERRLLQVNVPLTRGLLGYRLFLVKAQRAQELSAITSLNTLRRYAIGSGIGWPDNDVFAANGLKLVTSRYDNLWRMLDMERFDLFHRGVQEIFTELDRPEHSHLAVLPDVAVVFPFDYFFYVSRQQRELHDILLTGLRNAYQSGAFMAHFQSHPAITAALGRARLDQRTLIQLELPETYHSLTTIPARYWHHKQRVLQSRQRALALGY